MPTKYNAARCRNCGKILISTHRHDWVSCSCYQNIESNKGIFIDGGECYKRRGGNFKNLEEL